MGRSISGGGDSDVVAEVATSFPTRCLGAIRVWKKLWMIRDEEEEEKLGNWTLDGGNFFNKIIQFSNILLGHIREVTGGFLQDPQFLNWAIFCGPIRPHRSHHHKVIFLSFPFVSCIYTFTMH